MVIVLTIFAVRFLMISDVVCQNEALPDELWLTRTSASHS